MEQKVINGKTFLFVEVPSDAMAFYVLQLEIRYTTRPPHKMDWELLDEKLPVGEYEIIGKASHLNEGNWAEIVSEISCGERWENYCGDYPIWYHSAKESGLSLLASLKLSPSTTLILTTKTIEK